MVDFKLQVIRIFVVVRQYVQIEDDGVKVMVQTLLST